MPFQRSQADQEKDASPLGVYKKDFLQGGLDESTKRLDAFAKSNQQTSIFGGGTDGGFGLSQNKEAQRAVTNKRAQTRDYRLARRDAIRRNDRLGAARIGREAADQGFNLHGIGKFGADYQAAQRDLQGAEIGLASRYQSALGGLGNNGQGSSQGSAVGAVSNDIGVGGTPYGVQDDYLKQAEDFGAYTASRLGGNPVDDTFSGGFDTSNPVRGIDDAPYSPAYQKILDDTSGYRSSLAEHGNSASIPKFGDSDAFRKAHDLHGNIKTSGIAAKGVLDRENAKIDADESRDSFLKGALPTIPDTPSLTVEPKDMTPEQWDAMTPEQWKSVTQAQWEAIGSSKPKPKSFRELNGGKSRREVRIAKENEGLTDRQIEDKAIAKNKYSKDFAKAGTPSDRLTAQEWGDGLTSAFKAAWRGANELRESTSQPASQLAAKNKKQGEARQLVRDEIKKMEASGASRKAIKEAKDKLKQIAK